MFTNADLSHANFREAQVGGVNFDDARLEGADFPGAFDIPAHVADRLDDAGRFPNPGRRP